MSTCSNGNCYTGNPVKKRKNFWTFCNIKSIIIVVIVIYLLVTK